MIHISVILCTYNRCQSLAKALESLAASTVPSPFAWEVLVIDNNSSDDTPKVVEEIRSRYPGRFRYHFEPSQGKSFALNTGIRKAAGRVLAFIDDDVVADPGWLYNLTAEILAGNCSGTGGKILLDSNFVPPPWLPVEGPYSLAGMLAAFDLGDQRRPLDRPPFGTNMAFLRVMFDKYGVFRTDMGPAPGSEIRNEDGEFCRRVMKGGEHLVYEPAAVVYHAVPKSRRTQRYFLQFWFDHGRTSVRECGIRPAIAGIPHCYFSIFKTMTWSGPAAAISWLVARDPKIRFYRKGWLWMLAGEISEWWRSRPRNLSNDARRSSSIAGTTRVVSDAVPSEPIRRALCVQTTIDIASVPMNIAVILCTYNRCQSLARALQSLAASRMPDSVQWRVLVVDNNSNDQTRAVIEEFAHRFAGRFEYLFEPRQGKSYALNHGIEYADADVLCFVDDDVQVDPCWLDRLTAAFRAPQWAGAGGRIEPEPGFIPPRWLETEQRYALAPLAIFNPATPAGNLREAPFGANMAFRRKVFRKHGGFRIDLGPQPGNEIRNEDVEFGSRILNAGELLCYVPDAIVYHSVPRCRVTKSYFLNWWHGKGRAQIRQFGVDARYRLKVLDVPLELLARLGIWTVRWLSAADPARRFSSRIAVWELAGQIQECFAQSHKADRIRAAQLPNIE